MRSKQVPLGLCAKAQVRCWFLPMIKYPHFYMSRVEGENLCCNPQPTCPRLPGEGYEKCHSICYTVGHAEEIALHHMEILGLDPRGLTAFLTGHVYVCENCKHLLKKAGVSKVIILPHWEVVEL